MSLRDTIMQMHENGQKFLPVPKCKCISCGRTIDRAALNLIWYYDEPGAKPSEGGIATIIGGGKTTLVQFPVCDTCAPPCSKCNLPIKTKAVRQASRQVSLQLGRDVRGFPGCEHIHFPWFSLKAKLRRMFRGDRPDSEANASPSWAEQQSSPMDLPLPEELLGTIKNLLEQNLVDSVAGKVPERRLIPHHAIKRDIALRAFHLDFKKLSSRMQELNATDYAAKTNQIRRMDQHQLDDLIDAMRRERTDLLEIEGYVRSKNDRYKIVDPIFQRMPEKELSSLRDVPPVTSIELPMGEPDQGFKDCWSAAGRHLQSQTHDATINWLKADLNPPFLEHLSFRLGNQLFFVRIEDVDRRLQIPGTLEGVKSIAAGCKGHACLMPMKLEYGQWTPIKPGWGLIDASSGDGIDPFMLVSDEKVEMTDWELHDFAVQIVRDYVRNKLGHQIMSSQGNPAVDPSIWFVGESGPEWIVVRAVRYPERYAPLPANIEAIAKGCSKMGRAGHFASVEVRSSEQGFGSENTVVEPLWRGHGMHVKFEGLKPFQSPQDEQEAPSMGPGMLPQAEAEEDDWSRRETEEDGIRADARRLLKLRLQREGFLHPSRDRSTMSDRERQIREEAGRSLEEALARLANRSR